MTVPLAPPDWYGYERLSKITGLSAHGLSVQLHRARARRAEGIIRPADLPEPDAIFAGSPLWKRDIVLAWLRARLDDPSIQVRLDPERTLDAERPVPMDIADPALVAD